MLKRMAWGAVAVAATLLNCTTGGLISPGDDGRLVWKYVTGGYVASRPWVEDGRLYVFEVNVNPLIGEESLMAVLARKMGWYFPTFIHNIAMEAYRRSLRERRGVTLRDVLRREAGEGATPRGTDISC